MNLCVLDEDAKYIASGAEEPQRSAGILAGCREGVLALGAAGVTSADQPPGRRRYSCIEISAWARNERDRPRDYPRSLPDS
jgi:hypothetical protein